MQNKNNKNKTGYTIIETMIAVSLFVIIITIGMGALLNANLVHTKSQDMRSIIDNLSFIMEDVSRNLRTGRDYRCAASDSTTNADCLGGGNTVFFTEVVTSNRWGYRISGIKIEKSTDGGANWVQLNNVDEVNLDSSNSNFIVSGSLPPPGDTRQPFVIIKLSGSIDYKDINTPFSLQTSVSQRLIDIAPTP